MTATTVPQPVRRGGLVQSFRKHTATWIAAAVCVFLTLMIGVAAGPTQFVNTLVTGGMWALMSVGLALIFGVMNIPHFAHGESFMIGAMVAYFVYTPLNALVQKHPNGVLIALVPFVSMAVATLAGALLGLLVDRLLFAPLRRRSREGWVMNAFLLTVGLSFVLVNGATLTIGPNFRGVPRYFDVPPLQFLGVRVTVDRVVAFAIAIVVIAILWVFLQRSNTGRAIRAVSQDESGAQMVGINLEGIQMLTFSLATATAALAGASLLFMFPAYPTVGLKPLYFSWYVVMLVGMGNVPGAIIGGFIVALLQTATQQFVGMAWEDVIPTALMIALLLVAPSGIFGSDVKGIQEQ